MIARTYDTKYLFLFSRIDGIQYSPRKAQNEIHLENYFRTLIDGVVDGSRKARNEIHLENYCSQVLTSMSDEKQQQQAGEANNLCINQL